jgi:hypothetical protein
MLILGGRAKGVFARMSLRFLGLAIATVMFLKPAAVASVVL